MSLYDRLIDELGDIADEIDDETILDDLWINLTALRLLEAVVGHLIADTDMALVSPSGPWELDGGDQ